MTHLGDLAGALIDREIDDAARDDAHRHLEGCVQCRREVSDQQQTKSLLAPMRSPIAPTPALLARLAMIPESARVADESDAVLELLATTVRRSRSRRLLGRTPPSRPVAQTVQAGKGGPASLKTSRPAAGRRAAVRSVAAAGFAASVVVGLGGAVSGSAAPAAAGARTAAPSETARTAVTLTALDTPVRRPEGRMPVSVVYRRP
ncbi:MAG: hypothetical protein QOH29_2811 [Actinomycetota bacterium]|nr:hypothetical protein [Actinomycetota bacterium]